MRDFCVYCEQDEKAVFLKYYARSEEDRDRIAHRNFEAWRAGINPLQYEDFMKTNPDWPHNTAWAGIAIDLENGWQKFQGSTEACICGSCIELHPDEGWHRG